MKNPDLVFLHCAEPRLGAAGTGSELRARDRLRAFERAVGAALGRRASALLVGGRLLEAGVPDPALLLEVEALLARARDGGAPVVTTAEAGEEPWLEQLERRGLVLHLAIDAAAGQALPSAGTAAWLHVVGLGRPRTGAELARRAARLKRPKRGSTTVALVWRDPGIAIDTLAAARGAAAYVAAGGGDLPASAHPAHDPGPLVRLDRAGPSPPEPGWLEVGLEGAAAKVKRVASGDRPLVVVRLDLAPASTPRDLDQELRRKLAALPAPAERPLLRIDVEAPAGSDLAALDEERLAAAARELLDPAEIRLEAPAATAAGASGAGAATGARTGRNALERRLLERLAASGRPGLAALAGEILEPLLDGSRDALERARATLERHLEIQEADRARR